MDENDCKPLADEPEDKFHSADFNCNKCEQTDCCYWVLYNEEDKNFFHGKI